MSEFTLSNDKTQISGLSLNGFAADIDAIWKWLDIRRDGQFKIIDQDNPTRIALENETLYLVESNINNSRDVKVEWDGTLSGSLNKTFISGTAITTGMTLPTSQGYTVMPAGERAFVDPPVYHKSSFEMDSRKLALEVLNKKQTVSTNTFGAGKKLWDDFKASLIKLNDAIDGQPLIGFATDKEPCKNDKQFCLLVDGTIGGEKETYYKEVSDSPLYSHIKKEGGKFDLSIGLSRNFAPKNWKMDTEFFTVKPNLTLAVVGKGKVKTYQEFVKILPTETDYKTDGKQKYELSLAGEVSLTGSLDLGVGLKGYIAVSGSAGVSLKTTLFTVTYIPANDELEGSIGPVSVETDATFKLTLIGFAYDFKYKEKFDLVKKIEL